MKNVFKKSWFLSFISFLPITVFAATNQITPVLITGTPTLNQAGIDPSNLSTLLGTVFNFGIAIAVVLALIMIILGGIELMTTDSWEKSSEGKEKIWGALQGLGLALVSWLLLYIINPNLVTYNGNLILILGTRNNSSPTTQSTTQTSGSQSPFPSGSASNK